VLIEVMTITIFKVAIASIEVILTIAKPTSTLLKSGVCLITSRRRV
jgi:hypothetical protein